MNPINPDYEQVYRRALEQYRRGEIDSAAALLENLKASDHASPEAYELLEDIKLQQKLTSNAVDFREAPIVRAPIWPKIGIGAGVALLLIGVAVLLWMQPWRAPLSASIVGAIPTVQAPPTFTPVPPTATPVPPTATLAPPTATPVMATPIPLSGPDGQIAVRLPEGQTRMVRSPGNIAIILDASGSMRAQVDGKTKMDIARDAVSGTIQGLPAETQLTLRTYGNQRTMDCSDLSLIRPLGTHDRAKLLEDLVGINPADRGMTPIAASLDALKGDLQAAKGFTAVLLVSDGEESCDGDPVAAAQALAQTNPQLRIHVIGFDIGDAAASDRLRAIAQIGGGSYFDARNPEELASAMQEAVQVGYSVLNDAGNVVKTGQVGGAPLSLPPGRYTLRLDSEEQTIEAQANVSPEGLTVFELAPDGNSLVLKTQ